MQQNQRKKYQSSRPSSYERQKQSISTRYRLIMVFTLVASVAVTAIAAYSSSLIPEDSNPVNTADIPPASTQGNAVADSYHQLEPTPPPVASAEESKQSEKVSDPYLVLVNHDYALPQDYEVSLAQIDNIYIDERIYEPLTELLAAASEDGVNLWIASGYRSAGQQTDILDRAIQTRERDGLANEEAEEDALGVIAVPGHSEHHTGLAVDFNTVSEDFEDTEEYGWLQAHAAKHGFVQRYSATKKDLTQIEEEVWHYRYVGAENAKEMNRLDLCLEEYVEYLANQME